MPVVLHWPQGFKAASPSLASGDMHMHVQAITSIGQLDFVLELAGSASSRQGILHFNTDLFDKATAHRMLGHYGVRISSPCP